MTSDAVNRVRSLAEQINTQNRENNTEIDRLADEIIRIALAPRPASPIKKVKFVKMIPPGAV